ncbi:MAG: hypothetical protein GX352_04235 [Clostridiales bacterium]|nr:hypothetical protein [Clostridiales bacterium]
MYNGKPNLTWDRFHGPYNQEAVYDYNNMPPEYPYAMPNPEYSILQPAIPAIPTIAVPPMPMQSMPASPVPPAPPMDHKMYCMMHMRSILENLMDKKVSLIIEGTGGSFDCIRILSANECVVTVETKNGICVIPMGQITALCMSEEDAEGALGNEEE